MTDWMYQNYWDTLNFLRRTTIETMLPFQDELRSEPLPVLPDLRLGPAPPIASHLSPPVPPPQPLKQH